MDKDSKFSKFVAKLEQKMLDGNQESIILLGTTDIQLWGGSNGRRCVNNHSSCASTANDVKCENRSGHCANTINGRKCINTITIKSAGLV